jgi:hypothetical protein
MGPRYALASIRSSAYWRLIAGWHAIIQGRSPCEPTLNALAGAGIASDVRATLLGRESAESSVLDTVA